MEIKTEITAVDNENANHESFLHADVEIDGKLHKVKLLWAYSTESKYGPGETPTHISINDPEITRQYGATVAAKVTHDLNLKIKDFVDTH